MDRLPADILNDIIALVRNRDVNDDLQLGRFVGLAHDVDAAPGEVYLMIDILHHEVDEVLALHVEEALDATLDLVLEPFLSLTTIAVMCTIWYMEGK